MAEITDSVDVLIIGAGPSGLTVANCFNGSKLRVRIIDNKSESVKCGKADGLKSISLEVFDSFGIGDSVRNEAQRIEEVTLWNVGQAGCIERSRTMPDRVPELGKPREFTLHQGRIEHYLISNLRQRSRVEVEWNKEPADLQIDHASIEDPEAYPLRVTLVRTNVSGSGLESEPDNRRKEIIHARYVLGCDGAHSWVRKRLGIPFPGDLTDSIWGVMDIIPKTNFPDIRKSCVVHSAHGTAMIVPREDKLVRFYVQMAGTKVGITPVVDHQSVVLKQVIDVARKILAPYSLDASHCAWWSSYRVGQRIAEQFSRHNRVFLAGDAVHTHSPKAGQGMNTGIQDAYNIGWKLRICIDWRISRSILSTYEMERLPVAQQLIEFDREYSKLFSEDIKDEHDNFEAVYLEAMKFTTGLCINYQPSILVGQYSSTCKEKPPACNLLEGFRLPDFQMVNQSDGVPLHIHHRLTCDGRFRVLLFPGDISKSSERCRLDSFGQWLTKRWEIQETYSKIEFITIHCAKRSRIELFDLPDIFHPWSDEEGWSYDNVYADDESYHNGHGELYRLCGIDKQRGCIVVVRPDGYIALICDFRQTEELLSYFSSFLLPFQTAPAPGDRSICLMQ